MPIGQAMIICDAVWRDSATGKVFILGAFSNISARAIPCRHPAICVYTAITNCHGDTPIVLSLVYVDPDATEDEEVGRWEQTVPVPDPLIVAEGTFALQNVVFAKEGEYRFKLDSGGEPMLERRLTVQLIGDRHG